MPASEHSLKAIRQTAAELLACTLCDLFPGTQLIDTSVSDTGFLCDVVLLQSIDERSIPIIEERMRHLAAQNLPIRTFEMVRNNAIAFLHHHQQSVKAELLSESSEPLIQLMEMDRFFNTCPESPLDHSGQVKAIKIHSFQHIDLNFTATGPLKITRFLGTAFPDNRALKDFLKKIESAKSSDHRSIGQEMRLYLPLGESGCWIWQPKGTLLRNLLKDYESTITREQQLQTLTFPLLSPINSSQKNSISIALGGTAYDLGEDPAPLVSIIFKEKQVLEKELPLRYNSHSQFLNNAPLSQLHGLLHSRIDEIGIDQIFCSHKQLESEVISSLQFIAKIIKIFGFDHQWCLNTHLPPNFKYREEAKRGIETLATAMKQCGLDYILDKQGKTPYGPRVEVKLADALGRLWQGPFVAINATHPNVYSLQYHGDDGLMQKPLMIARSILGPLERFIAVLIEKTSGSLPFWLMPEQIRVISINDGAVDYAETVLTAIRNEGFRGSLDNRLEVLSEKIHHAEQERIPYIVIIGEKEMNKDKITVRSGNGEMKHNITTKSFLEHLASERK